MRSLRQTISDLRVAFTLVPWRMRPKLILMLLGGVVTALADMAAVLLMLPVMELATGASPETSASLSTISALTGVTDPRTLLGLVLGTAVVLMIAKSLATIGFRWWSLGFVAEAQSAAMLTVTEMYTSAPWIHHRRRSSADILQTVSFYIPASFSSVMSQIISLAVDAISILALLLALLYVSPLTTAVAIVVFGGASLVIQAAMRKRLHTYGSDILKYDHESWRYLTPAIDGLKEIRLAEAEDHFTRNFARVRRLSALSARGKMVLLETPKHLLEIVMIVGVLVIALVLLALTDQATAFATLGVFAVAAVRMTPSLNRMVATLGVIRTNIPNLSALVTEIQGLRGESGRRQRSAADDEVVFTDADIEFENLVFQFPDAQEPVLDGVSGVIPQGHTVALVGSSGAGKTTFVELLLTLFDPDAGSMTVNGMSIHDHPRAWRRQLGVVTQDVFLLDRSVKENIALGVPVDEIDMTRLQNAIEMAQLEDFVANSPEGLDTVVGSRGTRVSGGQKQRLGIARALYRDPRVLVLDEATSALDNETEARITETIKALHGKMTIVVVAHRLSTVKHADSILFFSRGRIAARGTMEELAASHAEFARLVELGKLA